MKSRKKGTHLHASFSVTQPRWMKYGLFAVHLGKALLRDVSEGSLKTHAAGLAYATLVTIVPLLAISFSVLKGFGIHNQLAPFLTGFLTPLGAQGHDIAARIVTFVDNIKVGVLGSVGLAMLIFGVMSMMRKIEAAFNDIWRVKQERSMALRVRDYLSVLFIGPLFMSLSVAITEAFRNKTFFGEQFGWSFADGIMGHMVEAVPYALFVLSFTALYMFMPNTRVRLAPALISGAVAAVMWKIMGQVFGVFVAGAGNYAAIYSAFAALMLLMIWIYLGWLIVLIGAAMAYYIQNPSNHKISRRFRALSARVREKSALLVCGEISRAFYADEEPLTLNTLAGRVELPSMIVSDIVESLLKAGILAMTGTAFRSYYIPACPFDEVTADDMLKKLRTVEENEGIGFGDLKQSGAIDPVLKDAAVQSQAELAKITLKQLGA